MQKGTDYVDLVLGRPLWEVYLKQSEEKDIVKVMKDGAPTYQSKVAQSFCSQNSLELLPHPA